MRIAPLLALAAALPLLAGCDLERSAESASAETVTAPAPPEPAPQLCANPGAGWVLEFPGDWHTNEGGAAPPCTFFHPDEFTVPEQPETLVVALSVNRERAPFEVAVTDAFRRDVVAEDAEVDGRRARRAEYVATGEALVPAGMRVYEVVVDLGGDTLIATLRGVEGLDWERGKQVLDRMLAELRFAE